MGGVISGSLRGISRNLPNAIVNDKQVVTFIAVRPRGEVPKYTSVQKVQRPFCV